MNMHERTGVTRWLDGKSFFGDPHFSSPPCCFCAKQLPRERWKNGEGTVDKKSLMSFGDLPIHIKVCAFFVASREVTPSDPNPMSAPKAKREIILGCRTSRCCLDQVLFCFFSRGHWYILRPLHQLDCVWGFLFALILWLKPRIFFWERCKCRQKPWIETRVVKHFPANCRSVWQD